MNTESEEKKKGSSAVIERSRKAWHGGARSTGLLLDSAQSLSRN